MITREQVKELRKQWDAEADYVGKDARAVALYIDTIEHLYAQREAMNKVLEHLYAKTEALERVRMSAELVRDELHWGDERQMALRDVLVNDLAAYSAQEKMGFK